MRGKSYLAAALISMVVIPKSKAATSSLKVPQAQGVTALQKPVAEMSSSKPAQVYGQIRLEGMQYMTALPEAPSLTYSQLLSARLSILKETTWLDFAADASGGTFFSKGQSHTMVHEAYMATRGEKFKASLGRKKMDWSEVDHRWNLGLWQPVYALDALRPEEEGLTGLFLDYNTQGWEILAFGTAISIPNMGPDIREDNGGLASDSRWYRPPSRNYDFNNNINTISYKLNVPDQLELVKNGGGAMMGRLGNKERGPWMVVAGGYMPVNELILKRAAYKSVSSDKVDVDVTPEVTYHAIGSVDLGYSFGSMTTSISYLQDDPKEKRPEGDMSLQKLKPIQAYSAAFDFSLANILTRPITAQVEYLKIVGGGIQDITADGSPDSFTMFDSRLKFTDAVQIKLEGQLATFFRRPFVTRFKYLYDYDQKGSLLNTEFLYYPNQKWAVVMGGDVLGVQDENYKKSGFLNEFRANDRFYGGMTYVF
ncbi:transposase [Bdellovibrio svalbardensis]|uniref:Transposase n=1 Tax=Bdellovibrio svalbardensis TaxID=2972972 RepID=A0ABT6DH33_9BACT|nr:transposase [Bdellovibrio svalbardensis]MDG0816150.1 transposase [Bdellovibrio svalbardensis]